MILALLISIEDNRLAANRRGSFDLRLAQLLIGREYKFICNKKYLPAFKPQVLVDMEFTTGLYVIR